MVVGRERTSEDPTILEEAVAMVLNGALLRRSKSNRAATSLLAIVQTCGINNTMNTNNTTQQHDYSGISSRVSHQVKFAANCIPFPTEFCN